MPEGDSIHRLADKLRRSIVGETVRVFEARTVAGAPDLVGRAIVAVDAHGKNLFVRFDDGRALHVHLRMLGRVRIEAPAIVRGREALRGRFRHDLRIEVDRAIVTGSRIPVLRLVTAAEARRTAAALGPDLLAAEIDLVAAVLRLRALGSRPIGEAIMLQRVVAGIGNVYKSEVLWLERVHPETPVSLLDDATLTRILARARDLLRRNVRSGPRTTRTAFPGGPALWVYGRGGEPCPACHGPLEVLHQASRSTYFCPRCQANTGQAETGQVQSEECPAPIASSTRSGPSSPASRSGRSGRARSSARSTSRSR